MFPQPQRAAYACPSVTVGGRARLAPRRRHPPKIPSRHSCRSPRTRRQGQLDGETGAPGTRLVKAQLPALALEQSTRNGEPQPHAVELTRHEWLKQTALDLREHTS